MISKKVNGEKAVLFFESEFTIHEVKEVREIIKEIESKKVNKIVFDLSKVKYIDSSAIGLLVTVLKYTKKNEGYLKLYNPTDEIKRILKLVNLSSFFETVNTIE